MREDLVAVLADAAALRAADPAACGTGSCSFRQKHLRSPHRLWIPTGEQSGLLMGTETCSGLLFLAEPLESGIGAQRVPGWIEL